jgi:hypothetical protein
MLQPFFPAIINTRKAMKIFGLGLAVLNCTGYLIRENKTYEDAGFISLTPLITKC